ncbi:hypothetical protein [Mucilaginibacter antarcticus]|uniref:hypothetical protein n=1 Tax=Mucilaginibacter antarcticus TaxID=1855725 RepID=UPI003632DA2E
MRKFLDNITAGLKWFAKTRLRLAGSIIALLLLLGFSFCLPRQLFDAPTSYVLNDSDGALMGASIASDGQWRFPYNEDVPDKFKQCIITFEDKRFEQHFGIDPWLSAGR